MTDIALLVTDGVCLSSLAGAIDVMHIANRLKRKQLGDAGEEIKWHCVSPDGQSVVASSGLPISVSGGLDRTRWDAVLVCGIYYEGSSQFEEQLAKWPDIGQWLVSQWQQGALLAGNCTGTFLLGQAGLLNGKHVTTAWWAEKHFRRKYPKAELDTGQLITEDDRIICTGAITSILQLAIRLVEHFISPSVASLTAKTMLIDVSQTSQLLFISPEAYNEHQDRLVTKTQYWLQQNLSRQVNLAEVADLMAVSQRTLIRRFKASIHMTPNRYLQLLRVEVAKQLLETTALPVLDIAEHVGYQDEGAFSRIFTNHTSHTPRAYRSKFLKERMAAA